jgi:hypothetical protein
MSLACRIAEPDLLRRTTVSSLVREALEINANSSDALYLAGWVALNAQQLDLAQKLWQKTEFKQRQTQHPPRFYIIRFFLYALFYSSNTLHQSWHFFTLDSYFCCCCI